MFNLFGKKPSPAIPENQEHADIYKTAPGTQIHFHPDLIDKLKTDHRQLLAIYGEIKTLFDEGDYEQASQRLDYFKSELQGHLLTENIKLYIYLDHMLSGDEMNASLIKEFRHEMDVIAKAALRFLSKYEAIGVDKDLAPSFAKDFAEIGRVLGQRIKREEEVLYPLYLPAYK